MAERNLIQLLNIENLKDYKFHPAVKDRRRANQEPLDLFKEDGENAGKLGSEWWGYQAWYENKDRWKNCRYILSFMQFYPEGKDVWLFGGTFEKKGLDRPPGGKENWFYDVRLTEKGQGYIGRLKIIADGSKTRNYPYLKNVYSKLKFSEILEEQY